MNILQELTSISAKIYQVEQLLRSLSNENERLRLENEVLQSTLASHVELLERLQGQLENTPEEAGGICKTSALPVHNIRAQISDCLREMEKCIQLLEQQ